MEFIPVGTDGPLKMKSTMNKSRLCIKATLLSVIIIIIIIVCSCSTPIERSLVASIPPLDAPPGTPTIPITLHVENPGRTIPPDFLGLTYDAPTLADSHNYFDTSRKQFINLLNNLGKGVLCFGANGVEYTYWSRTPKAFFRRVSWAFFPNARAVLSPLELDRMFDFARHTGWRVILGLNLGANDPDMAADEAAYAMQVGADVLLAFQIGNEPDLYARTDWRSPEYTYADYHREFNTYAQAIRARVPNAPIAGPATASRLEWFSNFVKDEAENLVLSTNHHYPLNADPTLEPTNERYASIENLLSASTTKRTADLIKGFERVSRMNNVPLRFEETNSSYPGKDGLGDTFASALWCVDYLFTLAELGVTGANFFGGFICHGYTPICLKQGFFNINNRYHAQPLYYGMLFFHNAAQGRIVPVELNTTANVTAYATLADDDTLCVTVINKDANQTINAQITTGSSNAQASAFRLTAGSLKAQEGITFAGSSVNADGTWYPRKEEQVAKSDDAFQIVVPAASAVFFKIIKN